MLPCEASSTQHEDCETHACPRKRRWGRRHTGVFPPSSSVCWGEPHVLTGFPVTRVWVVPRFCYGCPCLGWTCVLTASRAVVTQCLRSFWGHCEHLRERLQRLTMREGHTCSTPSPTSCGPSAVVAVLTGVRGAGEQAVVIGAQACGARGASFGTCLFRIWPIENVTKVATKSGFSSRQVGADIRETPCPLRGVSGARGRVRLMEPQWSGPSRTGIFLPL